MFCDVAQNGVQRADLDRRMVRYGDVVLDGLRAAQAHMAASLARDFVAQFGRSLGELST